MYPRMNDCSGISVLNLGCGDKISEHPNVINLDSSPFLLAKKHKIIAAIATRLLRGARAQRLNRYLQRSFKYVYHDLKKGLPYGDCSVDAVYHSHVLEHIDRDARDDFLAEIYRVLKIGGAHRIVVPDFAYLCKSYLDSYGIVNLGVADPEAHEKYIGDIIEQMVRKTPSGAKGKRGIGLSLEMAIFGGARERGETHQWMYDAVTLTNLLREYGYGKVSIAGWNDSAIENWRLYGLECSDDGTEWKERSLYVEAIK
jgi:ubiquinone/menaquinone biosynthesis C-methylase UbiE